MKTLCLIAAGALALIALSASATASAQKTRSGFFRTPDKKIYCAYGYGGSLGGKNKFLVCGIRNGFLKPKPKNRCAKMHIDYVGNRIGIVGHGKKPKVIACAGDAGPFADPPAAKRIAYGAGWHGGGLSCISQKKAMVCRGKSGHGFFISATQRYHIH